MQVKKYSLSATIPVGDYANIIPNIEIETDNIEEAQKVAMAHIKELFAKHGRQPLQTNTIIETRQLESFNELGVLVNYDDYGHGYEYQGKKLLSASSFVSKYSQGFNAKSVAKNCETKWKVSADEIESLWRSNGQISAHFGTTVHKALEHYFEHKTNGKTIEGNTEKTENAALPKHPILKKIIKDFEVISADGAYEVLTEVFVTNVTKGLCGKIDRLLIVSRENKICRVQDYKINVDCEKIDANEKLKTPFNTLPGNKLSKYQVQMSFYASLLEDSGWTIEGIDAFVLESEWKKYTLENISNKIRAIAL